MEQGSAPVEFVMVAGLLVAVVLAAFQVCIAGLYRTVVTDAVSSASAYAALADVPDDAGVARARDLIESTLGPQISDHATIEMVAPAQGIVGVRARVALPVIGLWGVPGGLDVTGRAVNEVMP